MLRIRALEAAVGDAIGDGLGDVDCCGCSAGAAVAGSGGGGGAASVSTAIRARATTPAATGIATVSEPNPGRKPVFWADRLYALRSSVRWMPSAEAPAHGALA